MPVGVGCAVGDAVLGDVGEESRIDFTLIGPVVNSASRLCDTARAGQVCLSADLVAGLSPELRDSLTQSYSSAPVTVRVKPADPAVEALLIDLSPPAAI